MTTTNHVPAPDKQDEAALGLGRVARFVRFQARLWRYCAERLHHNNLTAMAAALSFHTIFALIPTLVLALLTLSSLGLLENSKESLRNFLAASGFERIDVSENLQANAADEHSGAATLPAAPANSREVAAQGASSAPSGRGFNVAGEILALVENVQAQLTIQRVGPIGIALFIWTAIGLLSMMEDALNRVFGAARNRSVVRRSLLYWSALTLGPIALVITAYLGQLAITTATGFPILLSAARILGWFGPSLVGVLLLAAIYVLLPNTAVHRQAALGGALAAALLWLMARWGFGLYVSSFVVSGNLYGILGALPLFLLWLYVSWLIFLFGAELAHTAANLRSLDLQTESAPLVVSSSCAIRVMSFVVAQYAAGRGATDAARVATHAGLAPEATSWLLGRLVNAGILAEVGTEPSRRYIPAKPSELMQIQEVLNACEVRSADSDARLEGTSDRAEAEFRARVRAALASSTLADLMRSPHPPASARG